VAAGLMSAWSCLEFWKQTTHSFSFQKEKAMFMRPWVSETPAIPSSPQRKALERAMS
jgi:hypothetical protein